MSTLKSIFECKICHGPLSECVILPCGETICRKHSHSIQDLCCPLCKKIHQVPKDGFPLNKLVNLLFETNIQNLDMGEKFRAAEESCSKLENSLEMFNNLVKNPYLFVRHFFEEIVDQLASKRQELKLENKIRSQNLLHELNIPKKAFFTSIKNLVGPYLELAEVTFKTIDNNDEFYSILESKIKSAKYMIDSLIDQSYSKLLVEYKSALDRTLNLKENVTMEKNFHEEIEKSKIECERFIKELKILKIDAKVYSSLKQRIDKQRKIVQGNIRRFKNSLLLNEGFDLESKLFNFPNIKNSDFIQSKNQRNFILDLKDLNKFENKSVFGEKFLVNGIAFFVGVKLEENRFGEINCLGSLLCSNNFNFCAINVEYSMQLSPVMNKPLVKKSCIQSFSPGFCKLASLNRYHIHSQKEHKLFVHVKILSLCNRNFSMLDFKTPKKKQKKLRKSFGQNLNQVTGPDFDLDYQPE